MGCGAPPPPGAVRISAGDGVASFALDAREVSVARFREFVTASGHRTDAEAHGWSLVFRPPGAAPDDRPAVPGASWWTATTDATWRRPTGPAGLPAPADHPVVQVSWNDAAAFCAAVGGRLPTSREWERAARGGVPDAPFPWGRRPPFVGEPQANLWDGLFPHHPGPGDGFPGLAPGAVFPSNGYGLFDMAGNVWEWIAGGTPASRPLRGGSFLCAENSCQGYRIAWENRAPADSAWNHTGFRCAF